MRRVTRGEERRGGAFFFPCRNMGLERSRGERPEKRRRRTEKFSSRSVGSPRRLGPRGGEENPQGKKDRARLTKRTLVGSQGAFYQTNSSFFSLKTTRMAQTHRANVIIQICLLRPLQKTVCSSSQCGSTFPNFSWAVRGHSGTRKNLAQVS